MRCTWSQARARAAEEAQVLLLQLATTLLIPIAPTHTVQNLEADVSELPQISPASFPLVPVELRRPLQRFVVALSFPPHVPGLPVAGSKSRQSRYGVALQVQCITLLDAGIPINVICS
jgi:hypothetical protein